MNLYDIIKIIERKHIILCGGTEEYREDLASQIVNRIISNYSKIKLYKIPPHLKKFTQYIKKIKNIFPIKSPLGYSVGKMGLDQIWDVHLDWSEEHDRKILVLFPEIGDFEEVNLYEIISDYITRKYILEEVFAVKKQKGGTKDFKFRLIATSNKSLNPFYKYAKIFIGRGEKDTRSDEDVARKHLDIINIDWV